MLLLFRVALKALYIFYPHIKVSIFGAHSFLFPIFLVPVLLQLLLLFSLLYNVGCLPVYLSFVYRKVGP